MRSTVLTAAVCLTVGVAFTSVSARQQTPPAAPPTAAPVPVPAPEDPIKTMVGRLDLEKYKATIEGLTHFGDRRQGTERNRQALDWIEAQLKSYGCTNTERRLTSRSGRTSRARKIRRGRGNIRNRNGSG